MHHWSSLNLNPHYPDDRLVIVALGNLNGGAPGAITAKLASAAHGERVVLASERKQINVSPNILAAYAGTYELSPNFKFVITLEGDHLESQATGQSRVPLFPESETMFFPKVVDAEIEFVKNDKGEVTEMILHQGGRDTKGVKK